MERCVCVIKSRAKNKNINENICLHKVNRGMPPVLPLVVVVAADINKALAVGEGVHRVEGKLKQIKII